MSTARKINLFASAVVVVAFFLPCVGSAKGPKLVERSAQAFEFAGSDSDWILIGVASLLFLLLPIVCHALTLVTGARSVKRSRTLAAIPLVFWVATFAYISIKAGEPAVPNNADGVSAGLLGTLSGLILGLIAAFARSLPAGDRRAADEPATAPGEEVLS